MVTALVTWFYFCSHMLIPTDTKKPLPTAAPIKTVKIEIETQYFTDVLGHHGDLL